MDKVGICNLALGWLGAPRIDQLNGAAPATTEEDLCARFYDSALRFTLEAKAWTFATKWEPVALVEASGVPDMPYRAAIPGTVVRVLELDDGSGTCTMSWRREGGYVVFADALTTVKMQVVTFEEDPTKYSPGFERALAARLAADVAGPLTEKRELVLAMERRFQLELSMAGSRDAKQGSTQVRTSSFLRQARGG